MKLLLTGSHGYIGTILSGLLIKEGHEVIGYDNVLYEKCTFGRSMPKLKLIKKDIRDVELGDVEGFDAVLHLAGLSNDPLGDLNPELTYEINYKASVRLAELSKKAGVARFIFSSSCSNYGAGGEKFLNEESELNPVTPYAVSKVKVEEDVSALASDSFSPVFLRNATAYGLSPVLRFDLVLNNLVAWAYTTGHVHIKSDGTPWRPIVHIEDIARAFAAVLNADRDAVHNEAFNVGINSENFQIRDIADIVKDVVPDCEIAYANDASPDKRCYRVDCSKIVERIPGFKPQWTAQKGARELYEAYKKYGVELEEFEGIKYKRVGFIKNLIANGELDHNLRWVK